jgi:signal transduction histidine kinase
MSSVADVAGLSLRVRGHAIALNIDISLLRRIVVNLLDNALHYTTQGGVLLSCRHRISRQEVWVQIWDTGQGIDASHIESIFEAYTRQDGAKLNPSGVGLGLALCLRFSQAMGLTLAATSRPGRGSVFTLKIPIAHVAPD